MNSWNHKAGFMTWCFLKHIAIVMFEFSILVFG
jgi:hypothetical protein